MTACILNEIKMGVTMPCYTGAKEKMLAHFDKDRQKSKLGQVCNMLGKTKFLAGDDVTWIDFYFLEMIYLMQWLCEKEVGTPLYTNFPEIEGYFNNMINLPKLKEYLEGDCMDKKLQFNNKMAKVNNEV